MNLLLAKPRLVDFTDHDIDEFIAIWEKEFGERVTPDEARKEAELLMQLYWALVQPLPGKAIGLDIIRRHRWDMKTETVRIARQRRAFSRCL